jgi:inner membrane protein
MVGPAFPFMTRPAGRTGGWGGKALLVFALALLMAIPGVFVFALVADREHRAASVTSEVSAMQGGKQQVLGPMLVVPYSVPRPPGDNSGANASDAGPTTGWYVISPDTGSAAINVVGSSLHRSIFYVPVYEAIATLHAHFNAPPRDAMRLPANATVDWSAARIVVGFTDLRGAKSDVVGTMAGQPGSFTFSPASDLDLNGTDATSNFGLVSAPALQALLGPNGGDIDVKLRFTGADRLGVMPFAKSTMVQIAGNWPSPSLDGAITAETRNVTAHGFSAAWSVPFIARGLSDHGETSALSLGGLGAKDLGVTFLPINDPYANVDRALKYIVMFVGLVFLSFFVFEALSGRRLHPAQYLMVGLAQMVFYLLLLSLSEYIGFDWAFAAGATATVLVIGLYAGAAFKSHAYTLRALAVFGLVYGLIYLLLRLDDFALLAGSIASFLGLAGAMYLTRNIDWYGKTEPLKPDAAASPARAGV